MKLISCLLALGLMAANIAVAAVDSNDEANALPPPIHQGNAIFISGGVGKDEAMAFQRNADNFPLELEFVMKDAPNYAFLSDVQVTIRDRSGNTVLDTVTDGPFLLASLPAGTYHVTASNDGVVRQTTVAIGSHKHRKAVLVWPNASTADD